jgi:hypothetical protein
MFVDRHKVVAFLRDSGDRRSRNSSNDFSMRRHLEIKLVNPTKVFSRTPHDLGVDEFLSTQAQVDTGAGGAGVLGKRMPRSDR